MELVRKKHCAWQRFIGTQEQVKLQEYRRIRNQVWTATIRRRKDFELSLVKDVKGNPKRFWSYVNSKTKTRSEIPHLLMKENDNEKKLTTDEEKVAEFGK